MKTMSGTCLSGTCLARVPRCPRCANPILCGASGAFPFSDLVDGMLQTCALPRPSWIELKRCRLRCQSPGKSYAHVSKRMRMTGFLKRFEVFCMWRFIITLVPPCHHSRDFLWFQNLVPYPIQLQHSASCAAPNAQEPIYKDQPSRHETITRPFAATVPNVPTVQLADRHTGSEMIRSIGKARITVKWKLWKTMVQHQSRCPVGCAVGVGWLLLVAVGCCFFTEDGC